MVRSELLQKMCNLHPNIIRKDMEKILEIIFLEIADALCEGKNIEIRGFGVFSKKYIRPRRFMNPKTKEIGYLGETASMHFKSSKKLLNSDG